MGQDKKPLPRVFLAEDQEEMRQTIVQILCEDFQIVAPPKLGQEYSIFLPTLLQMSSYSTFPCQW